MAAAASKLNCAVRYFFTSTRRHTRSLCDWSSDVCSSDLKTVPDYDSFKGLFIKRLRWLTVMRHMRPWGHIGLTFTQGLPWSLAMLLTHPADGIGAAYIGAYALSRLAITWLVGAWGLQQRELWKKMPLVFVWDASAFFIWLLSFGRRRIRWRNVDYRIRDGILVPVAPNPASNSPR